MTFKPVDVAIIMVVGPIIDDTDFKSLEEAIAYNAAGMDVSLIVEKTDGTTSVTAITLTTGGTSDWTHKDGGYYEIEVTAAQNAEEGIAYIRGICTGVLPFESPRYSIVKANVYDSLIKGTDVLQVDVTQLAGVAQSLTDLKDFADVGYSPSDHVARSNLYQLMDSFSSGNDFKDLVDTGYDPVAHKMQGVVLADEVTALTGHTAQTGDSFARLGAPTGASIAADLVVIDNFVDELESRLSAIRAGYLDNLSAGAVALAATALTNITWTDAKAAFIDASIAAIPTTAMRGTDNAALAATALSDAVWTDAKAAFLDHSIETVDTVADGIQSDLDNATDGLGALKTLIDTVDGIVDAIKAKTDNLPSGIAKNVALPKFDVFMVLSSDHVTAATGKTITGEISKDGGSFTAITNAITEVGSGSYIIADGFTQTEMNADIIILKFDGPDCNQRTITIHTT